MLFFGSMAKRLGIEEGTVPSNVVYELCYKNDTYGDPLINDDHLCGIRIGNIRGISHN